MSVLDADEKLVTPSTRRFKDFLSIFILLLASWTAKGFVEVPKFERREDFQDCSSDIDKSDCNPEEAPIPFTIEDRIDQNSLIGEFSNMFFSTTVKEIDEGISNYNPIKALDTESGIDQVVTYKSPISALSTKDGINEGLTQGYNYIRKRMDAIDSNGLISVAYTKEFNFESSSTSQFCEEFWPENFSSIGYRLSLTFVMVYVYLSLLQTRLVSIAVWAIIILTNVLMFLLAISIFYGAKLVMDSEVENVPEGNVLFSLLHISYLVFAVAGLFFVLVVRMRKSIHLSLAIVRQTSSAIIAMPLIFPLQMALQYLAVGLFSYVKLTNPVFVVWVEGFMLSICKISVPICVAKWYFAREKSEIGSISVLNSVRSSSRHIGTVAIGVSIVVFPILIVIPLVVTRFENIINNFSGIALKLCFVFLLSSLQGFIRFLVSSTFIQTAVFGTRFSESLRAVFVLMTRNSLKFVSLYYVKSFVSMIGESFLGMVIPVIFSGMVADVLSLLFNTGAFTLLFCFLADPKMFHESQSFV